MATDNSPTRNKLIFILAAVTVVILGGLKFVFDDYFAFMMEGEAKAKAAPAEQLQALHADEDKKLTGSPLPINQAMHDFGSKGHQGSALLAPQASNDDAPLVGWSKGEHAIAVANAPKAPEPAPVADGGATDNATGLDASTPAKHDAGSAPRRAPRHP